MVVIAGTVCSIEVARSATPPEVVVSFDKQGKVTSDGVPLEDQKALDWKFAEISVGRPRRALRIIPGGAMTYERMVAIISAAQRAGYRIGFAVGQARPDNQVELVR